MFATLALCCGACSGGEAVSDGIALGAPIHMQVATDHLQPRMGLSGFIFGTFLLLNAYLMIIAGCILLVVKEKTVQVILDTVRMGLQMFNPKGAQKSPLLDRLGDATFRSQAAAVCLIGGLLLAYLGAWIAM